MPLLHLKTVPLRTRVKPVFPGLTATPTTLANTFKLARSNGKINSSKRSIACLGSSATTFRRYYTWGPSSINSGLEFVPMLWGEKQLSQWDNAINQTVQTMYVTHALGFNEPEITVQANLSSSDAANLWKAHIEPLKGLGVQLGSPAPSGSPQGKQWLLDWMEACGGGCTVDFIAVHYYDINSTGFMEYLEDYHDTFQRPVWVTEWACQVCGALISTSGIFTTILMGHSSLRAELQR